MHRNILDRVFVSFVFVLCLSPGLFLGAGCSDEGGHSPQFTTELQAEMTSFLSEKMAQYTIPGAVVGIWVPGRGTWVKAKGKADIEADTEMGLSRTFRIGSITKTFTVTIILQLVDEGLLSLDDTLDGFVPWVPNSAKITIRQLCSNTSGIVNYGEDSALNQEYIQSGFLAHYTPEELVQVAIGHEPYFPPGKGFHYSNTNFVLLGMIIEQITGNTLETALESMIFSPLNLRHTSFPIRYSTHMTGHYSHGYLYVDGILTDYTVTDHSIQWGAGGIISDLADLKTWAEALGEGLLISPRMQAERLKWSPYSVNGIFKYGLGIFYLGDFIGHDGGCIGFNAALFYLPSRKATFIILLNQSNDYTGALDLFMGLANKVFPGVFQAESLKRIPLREVLPYGS